MSESGLTKFGLSMPASMSLSDYYDKFYDPKLSVRNSDQYMGSPSVVGKMGTPFTRRFLDGKNLKKVQSLLTEKVRYESQLSDMTTIEFTDSFLASLMDFATTYRLANVQPSTDSDTNRINQMFVDQTWPSYMQEENDTSFWNRWCQDGIPDPGNIPLPILGDREERNPDPASYLLNHPWGSLLPEY